jgi:hypothetical protein
LIREAQALTRRQCPDVRFKSGVGVFELGKETFARRLERGGDRVRRVDDFRSRRISFGAVRIAALCARDGIKRGEISAGGEPERSKNFLLGRSDRQPGRLLQTADQRR